MNSKSKEHEAEMRKKLGLFALAAASKPRPTAGLFHSAEFSAINIQIITATGNATPSTQMAGTNFKNVSFDGGRDRVSKEHPASWGLLFGRARTRCAESPRTVSNKSPASAGGRGRTSGRRWKPTVGAEALSVWYPTYHLPIRSG
jgi:hypothetical protein